MISIRSFLQQDGRLVPIEDVTTPPVDEDYIDGVIEMIVDGHPILEREKVDLVDQLWTYLVQGLESLVAGEDFSTFYPDMPLEVRMTRDGTRILLTSDDRDKINQATVELDELKHAMVSAATVFFERLRTLSPANEGIYTKYLARLASLR